MVNRKLYLGSAPPHKHARDWLGGVPKCPSLTAADNSGMRQSRKSPASLDHLVGGGEQYGWYGNA